MARKAAKKAPARSRGSIIHRGEGTYLVRVYTGTDEGSGKRKYHNETVKGTKKDAEKALTKILRDLDTGQYIPRTGDTLNTYYEEWLKSKRGISPKTRQLYRSRIERDILPVIGEKKIADLRKSDVERVIARMEDRNLASRTIHIAHTALNMMLTGAIQSGLLLSNPCQYVELPARDAPGEKATALTQEQVAKLLAHSAQTRNHALWTLLITAGLRPSEALALTWEDYDGKSVQITKSLSVDPEDNYRPKATPTKTKKSRRTVPLFQIAIDALNEHHHQQKLDRFKGVRKNPMNLIFCGRDGQYPNMDYLRTRWKKLLKDAGLPGVRLYDTRHTHITHLLVAGVHPKVVSERAGHANIGITLDTYTHLAKGMQEEAMQEAEKKLSYGA